jgi:hypothetical protein
MVLAYRRPSSTVVAGGAVASSLLFISCIDGFLKNTHGNTLFYILKDLALISILCAIGYVLANRPWTKPVGTWNGLWAWQIFIGYQALQILNPGLGISAGVAGFRANALFSLLFIVGALCFTNPKRLTATVNVAIFWIVFAAAAGLFQSFEPSIWNSWSPGLAAATHKYTDISSGDGGLTTFGFPRSYGTLVDPAAMGLACVVGFLLAAGALARSRGFARAWYGVAMIVLAVALQLSGSRLSVVSLGVGLIVFLALSWRHRSMRVPAAVAFTLLVIAVPIAIGASGGGGASARLNSQQVDYAAMTRARSRALVLASIPTHPLGLGLGATGAGGRKNGASRGDTRIVAVDNLYWATVYQTGIPGLVIFLVLQGLFLRLAVRWANQAKSVAVRATYISFAALEVALLTSGIWTQGSFQYAPSTQVFWLLAGALALPKRVEGEGN